MKIATLVVAILAAVAGTAMPLPAQSAEDAPPKLQGARPLADLLDAYTEEWLPLNPLSSSRLGDHRYDDVYANVLADDYRRRLRALYVKYLEQAGGIAAARLDAGQALTLEIFRWELTHRLELMDNDDYLQPVTQLDSAPTQFALLGSGANVHPFKTVRDYENFLKRIDGFLAWNESAIANMRTGMAKGVTQPRVLMEKTLPQLQAMVVTDVTQSAFYRPIIDLPASFSAEDKARLTEAYAKAIRERLVPAYRRLHDFIRDNYLPHCRESAGMGALPDGAAQYARLTRWYTTTGMTPDEIHALGLVLVSDAKEEMEAIAREVGFKGDLKAFNNYVSSDPKFFPYHTDDEILAAYRGIGAKVEAQVPKLFRLVPRSRLEVRPIEKFRAAAASAHYQAGSPDGARPGVFYVPIPDPLHFTSVGTDTLYVHEAVPGHHFQVSLQQELDLPRFRKLSFYSAFGEGWAVYAETLGTQLGVMQDPYQRYGRLIGLLRGATSLVVDTGLHAKGWTREHALEFFRANAIGSEDLTENRVERYMARPAQTLSYLIGERKIIDLRARAEQALGSRFDARDFHDEVLKDGSMPLSVLEKKIDAWIARRKS